MTFAQGNRFLGSSNERIMILLWERTCLRRIQVLENLSKCAPVCALSRQRHATIWDRFLSRTIGRASDAITKKEQGARAALNEVRKTSSSGEIVHQASEKVLT
jgi:hypothetical protein